MDSSRLKKIFKIIESHLQPKVQPLVEGFTVSYPGKVKIPETQKFN